MDVFIHENFFGLPWQTAYVFDPHSGADGFFFWDKEKLLQEAISILVDEEATACEPITEDELNTADNIAGGHPSLLLAISWALSIVLIISLIGVGTVAVLLNRQEIASLVSELENLRKQQDEDRKSINTLLFQIDEARKNHQSLFEERDTLQEKKEKFEDKIDNQ